MITKTLWIRVQCRCKVSVTRNAGGLNSIVKVVTVGGDEIPLAELDPDSLDGVDFGAKKKTVTRYDPVTMATFEEDVPYAD